MIVGITGHQKLGDAASVAWIRGAIEQQVRLHGATLGMSSLARGADQLFVDVLRGLDIPFEVVVPCTHYEETFPDEHARSSYSESLATARHVNYLPYTQPSEESFFAAGKWIVAHCELLLAVWNGLPACGLGGTADVVTAAISSSRAWVHIDPVRREVCYHAQKHNHKRGG